MQSKLLVSLAVVAAIVATLALRARDGGPSEPPTAPASPSVAGAAAATAEREAGGVGLPSATERAAVGPATSATLALVDETGAARSDCVVFLRERGGWRVLGHADADGHVAVGAVAGDVPEPCELAVARRDLRATRIHVERAVRRGDSSSASAGRTGS